MMLLCSILNMKKHFSSWVYFCVYPYFLGWYGQKNVVRNWRFRTKIEKGVRLSIEGGRGSIQTSAHYVPSQTSFKNFWLKVSQEGIYRHHFDFFHAHRHLKNTKQTIFWCSMRKWEDQSFLEIPSVPSERFWFMNFVDINPKKTVGINYANAVFETFYFWHQVLFCRMWTFWCFFSEIYISLINCKIAICKLNLLSALLLL